MSRYPEKSYKKEEIKEIPKAKKSPKLQQLNNEQDT